MKKTFELLTVLLMIFTLFSSNAFAEKKSETPMIGMANPLHEATSEEVMKETGFSFQEPAGSEDVSYCIIDGEPKIAQMTFTFDDHCWTFRMAATGEETDISGMNYKWKKTAKVDVDYNKAKASWIKNEQGMIQWYDAVPGVMYSLSVDSGANKEMLSEMANTLFYPLQGETDGSFAADFTDVLHHLQENYQPGTAGCSLKAACLGAECMDLLSTYQPEEAMVSDVLKEFYASLRGDAAELFPEQLGAMLSACEQLLGEMGDGLLESCGYESEMYPWSTEQMTAYCEAMALQ